MNIGDFNFNLPDRYIAVNPVEPRDHCKLMVLDRAKGLIIHDYFYNLGKYLGGNDVLVFNKSKVILSRLRFTFGDLLYPEKSLDDFNSKRLISPEKEIEVFLCRNIRKNLWTALVKPGKRLPEGSIIKIGENKRIIIGAKHSDGMRTVSFCDNGEKPLDKAVIRAIIDKCGVTPLPPYIKNSSASIEDYQTIYAEIEGSVAAPTAGLHFTAELMKNLVKAGTEEEFVTLHVGPGTFLPVKTDNLEEHKMHEEEYFMDFGTSAKLTEAVSSGKRLVAVGTTAVRVLESNISAAGVFKEGKDNTDIFIYPGYKWKCVGGMITNFHLPKSTLLLLVCAFAGKDFVMRAYNEAIEHKYRFYSFGDAMLII